MAKVVKADRVWIAQYNENHTHFWNTHEWARPGVTRHVEDLQGVPVQIMIRLHQRMMDRETILIHDVEKMPRSERSLQAELRRQKIKSSSVFPLVHKGKVLGFYGFDLPVVMPAGWDETLIEFKRCVAVQLAGLVAREPAKEPGEPALLPVRESGRKVIYIKSSKSRIAVDEEQILMLHSFGDYTWVHLVGGRRFMQLRSLRTWELMLNTDRFLRLHKRFVVRADMITGVEKKSDGGWSVGLKGWSESIPVGRAYRHLIRQKMGF